MTTDSAELPFAGLKVIDCASFIAAPASATILADYGADVVKIEPPEGDAYRELYRAPGMPATDRNFPWELDSRGKRSLVLDLKLPAGLAVLHKLVEQADVFITNLPLPVRRRLGIGYEHLGPRNERLIYASFTAYGEQGPEAEKTGFDSTAYWARSGLMDLMRADYQAPPVRSVAGLGDHPSGAALFGAIATGLYRRERTGRGGLVSASLLGNGLWANSYMAQARLTGVQIPKRLPRTEVANPMTNIYRCADGRWLNLVMLNEARQLGPLLDALDCVDLIDDPRFDSQENRRANAQALIAVMDERFAQRTLADWRERLDAAGITFGVVGTMEDLLTDEQMRAAGVLLPFADPAMGLTVASPVSFDGKPMRPPGASPSLGQHSAQVLRDAGYSDDEISKLRALKVLN